jgi:hypothetical protein
VLFLFAGAALSGVPEAVHFQGYIEDAAGDPLDGTYSITFGIYDADIAGTALWSESSDVHCDNGFFDVMLGTATPLSLSFSTQYWLGCRIAGDEEMAPRYRLSSVPYAMYSAVADSAERSLEAVVAHGMDWDDIWDIPFGFADGVDNIGADTAHCHDGRYYTKSELSNSGTLNDISNPVDWTKLKSVPSGFSDGIDNVGGAAGGGWIDDGTVIRLEDPGDSVGIGTASPGRKFTVDGVAGGKSGWYSEADAASMTGIEDISGALAKVTALRGVSFEWDGKGDHPSGRQLGFVAHEVGEIVPEVVDTGGEYSTIAYANLVVLLAEAIEEQQRQIMSQQERLRQQGERIEELETELTGAN